MGQLQKGKGTLLIIHYFLVEFGHTGELYDIGCVGDKNALLNYFYSVSRDVRYKKQKESTKDVKLWRQIGQNEYIVSCKFYCDSCQSLGRSRKLTIRDERYTVYGK